jgi:hypothetical protein
MYFLDDAIKRQLTTSRPERTEYVRNLLNSAFDCPIQPSAMLRFTESAAFFI